MELESAVLDASVFVSMMLPREQRHEAAKTILFPTTREPIKFYVPTIFEVEVLAALGRREALNPTLGSLFAIAESYIYSSSFDRISTDSLIETAIFVSKATGITAYDALYLALAIVKNLPLITFDTELKKKTANNRKLPPVIIFDETHFK